MNVELSEPRATIWRVNRFFKTAQVLSFNKDRFTEREKPKQETQLRLVANNIIVDVKCEKWQSWPGRNQLIAIQ